MTWSADHYFPLFVNFQDQSAQLVDQDKQIDTLIAKVETDRVNLLVSNFFKLIIRVKILRAYVFILLEVYSRKFQFFNPFTWTKPFSECLSYA